MKRIRMNTTHASPTEVLHEGQVYAVDDELAAKLLEPESGANGKPAARLAKASEKAKRPTKPDPGEKEVETLDDDDDETDDEDK